MIWLAISLIVFHIFQLANDDVDIDYNKDDNENNANSVYGEAICHWNYTILQNSHRKSGFFILKKGKPQCER